jgi:hypothetical protein
MPGLPQDRASASGCCSPPPCQFFTGLQLWGPDSGYVQVYTEGDHGTLVTFGLYVIPFAGIFFLWHLTRLPLLIKPRSTDEFGGLGVP